MQLFVKKAILTVALVALVPAGRSPAASSAGQSAAPQPEADITTGEFRTTLDVLFHGHPHEAATLADSFVAAYPRGPLALILRARVQTDFLPVDDEQKDDVKRLAVPIHTDLERAIALCTRRLDRGSHDPQLILYRGWAWMLKAQTHTFERSFWSAGRDARKGKDDLERYLARFPDDPIANGVMGGFLYFADTLPSAFKLLSKLLFLPTGNREEGLERMRRAIRRPGPLEVDARVMLYSVYIAFEGRYEDGLAGFELLQRRYPECPTFLRPFAVTMPLTPRYQHESRKRLAATLDSLDRRPALGDETPSYHLLQFLRAWADRFYAPARAESLLARVVEDNPEHPDWVAGYARLELGRMAASRGDVAAARAAFTAVAENSRVEYLHDEAREMESALDSNVAPTAVRAIPVDRIYTHPEDRAALLRMLETQKPPTVQSEFYLGETLFLLGDATAALDAYERVAAFDARPWDQEFQMIACSRLAEIHGSRLEYDAAVAWLSRARGYWHREFLYDWLLENRMHFYERLATGESTEVPTLFSAVP